MKRCFAFVISLLLLFSCCAVSAESAPAIRDRDEVYASGMEEAYAILAQRFQSGMEHYMEMQEADNALMAEMDDFRGNSPLYTEYLDVTGDGQAEMLFLATREDAEDWESDSADLWIYTWKGDHAEQILWIGSLYVIAGDGPWYEIYQDGTGSGALYLRYGCDTPGVLAKYELNGDGQYVPAGSVSAYCDYEAVTEEDDGFTYYVNGVEASKEEYEAARNTLAVDDRILVAYANVLDF